MIFESGIILIMLAGVMNGSFVIPTRYIKNISNDQVWFFHAIIGLIIVPWLIISLYFPDTLNVYFSIKPKFLTFIIISGLIFGIGQVCFAYAIRNIGISISFAVNLGIGVTLGSIFVLFYHSVFLSLPSFFVILSVLLITISLLIFYISGKNKTHQQQITSNNHSVSYRLGWLLVLFTGITSGLQNITFIILLTQHTEYIQISNPFWIWPPFLTAAALSMLIGFGCQVRIQKTKLPYLNALLSIRSLILIITMGILFTASLTLYSTGMQKLTEQQQIIGWPLFMILIIFTSQFWGWIYNEFNTLSRTRKVYKLLGILLLIIAIIVLASIKTI